MKRTILIGLMYMVWAALLTAQPSRSIASRYPATWDINSPEYTAVFDGVDDFLNTQLQVSPDVVIEMEVLIPPGYANFQKMFGGIDVPYYSLGIRNDSIYRLADNLANNFTPVVSNTWTKVRFDPKRGFVAFGDKVDVFTARNVSTTDTLIFGGQWDDPLTNFMRYEWRYIKVWDKGRLTHYLTPQADGRIKNLKTDTYLYNKGDTTNAEPFSLRYLGNIPNASKTVSSFDGISDRVTYTSFNVFDEDSVVEISFKFKPSLINQNTVLLSDRLTNRNFHIYLSDNERFSIMTTTAAGTFYATSTGLESYYADSIYTVNVVIDQRDSSVTCTGSFNMAYTYSGDLELAANTTLYIGQRNTSYFAGEIWDININDKYFIPLPDAGFGFEDTGSNYVTIPLTIDGSPDNVEALYGTDWANKYGYVYRASTDKILLNNPYRNEAYALTNGDIHYHLLGASTTNYYVNPFAGNDGNTGTSPATAWASVAKVNAMQGQFYGGDSVLFMAGSVFTDQLIPTKSGSPATKINYGKYGTGANPQFSGFKTLTQADFTNTSGDIWLSNTAVTTNSDVKVLYTDEKVWSKARMPNPDGGSRLGYHMMNAHGNFAWLASDELDAGYDYTGMQIASRKAHWIIDLIRVTSQSGTTLYVDEHNPGYPFKTGGFFFFNDERCVDLDNEWWFDFDTKRLGIQKSGTFTDIYISDKEYLIDLNGVNHLSFTNLDFEGANVSAFYMRNVDGIKIEDCNILYSYDGIKGVNTGNPSRDLLITNNNIKHLMNNGVWLDTDFRQGVITYNQIDTIAPFPGMGGEVDGTYNGLRIQGDSMDIGYNTLVYIGYNPISFNGHESKVHHNFIYWFNHVKDDGSAIYVANTGLVGREIYDNLIMHGIGAPAGYVEKVNPWDAIEESNGIYLDLYATGVDVYNNVVYDVPNMGIFLHLTRYDCNIYNNLVFDARGYNGMVNIQSEIRNNDTVDMTNINVYDNTLIAATENQLAFRIETWLDNLETIGYFDNNTFANPIDSDYVVGYRYPKVSGTQRLKLAAYQDSLPSMEQNSVDPKKTVYLRETFEFVYNPSRTDSLILTFPDTMMNFHYDTIFPGENFVLQPLKADVLINAGNILPYRRYYFSNDGVDTNTGLDSLHPKKSMKELVALMPRLIAGDSVLFKRGDVWHVPNDTLLRIKKSGEDKDPIHFSAYGTGANPLISGYKTGTTFTPLGGNIYESVEVTSTILNPKITNINGAIRQKGRFPNTGWLSISESFVDEQLTVPGLGGYDFTGADLVSRKTREVIDVAQITYHSTDGLITMATGREYTAGYGVFVSNSPNVLDVNNEWYFDPSTGKARVYSTSPTFDFKMTSADYLVDIQQQRNIVIENIDFEGANISAIWLKSGKGVTIKNCNIKESYNGVHAMRYTSAGLPTTGYGLKVIGNSFEYITNNALNVESEYGDAQLATNTFNRIGEIAGLGASGFGAYSAIRTETSGVTVTDNVLSNMGYLPIELKGKNATATGNYITNYCTLKDNTAGINITGQDTGRVISSNIILNGVGNYEGTPFTSGQANGITVGDGSTFVSVTNNSVYNMSNNGLFVQRSYGNNTIEDNSFVNCRGANGVVNFSQDNISIAYRNSTFRNNLLIAGEYSIPVVRFYSVGTDLALWGTINNNVYANPLDVVPYVRYQQGGGALNDVSIADWTTFSGHDAATTDPAIEVAGMSEVYFEFNPNSTGQSGNSRAFGVKDFFGIIYPSGSFWLEPKSSKTYVEY